MTFRLPPRVRRLVVTASLTALMASGASADPTRILCIGDSLTQANPGYRLYLYEMLRDAGYDVIMVGPKKEKAPDGGQLDHAGSGGFTIGPGPSKADEWSNGKGNISANIENHLKSDPEIILLLIGTNEFFNIGKLQPDLNPNRDSAKRLADLVDKIHATKPGVKVLVGSVMPVAWDAKFAQGLNSQLPELLAGKENTVFVDTGKLAGFVKGDWSGDGLHPSPVGHRKLAQVWFEALKPHLTADPARVKTPAETPVASAQAGAPAGQAEADLENLSLLWDFTTKKPSYGYVSWARLDESGTQSSEGWQMNAPANGGFGLNLNSPIDLSAFSHLVLRMRKDAANGCDIHIKLIGATGDRLYTIKKDDLPLDLDNVLVPLGSGFSGNGDISAVKQIQVQGNFNASQKFAYTLEKLEAASPKTP